MVEYEHFIRQQGTRQTVTDDDGNPAVTCVVLSDAFVSGEPLLSIPGQASEVGSISRTVRKRCGRVSSSQGNFCHCPPESRLPPSSKPSGVIDRQVTPPEHPLHALRGKGLCSDLCRTEYTIVPVHAQASAPQLQSSEAEGNPETAETRECQLPMPDSSLPSTTIWLSHREEGTATMSIYSAPFSTTANMTGGDAKTEV